MKNEEINGDYDSAMEKWIKNQLDIFFDQKDQNYRNMELLKEIFEKLEDPIFKENFPKQAALELKRIRDLYNVVDTALNG